jgi:Protein of unknown function (DUF1559)
VCFVVQIFRLQERRSFRYPNAEEFPSAAIPTTTAAKTQITNGSFSAHARLLAALDQTAIYNAANFSLSVINDATSASFGSSLEFIATQASPPNGVFQYTGPPIGIRDILDGTSTTAAFDEQLPPRRGQHAAV